MSLIFTTLILDLVDGALDQVTRGTAQLVPSAQLVDTVENDVVAQAPVTVTFRTGAPPQARILCTDNADLAPSGWAWTISFSGVPGSPPPMTFFLLAAGNDGSGRQYLSSLAPVSTAPATSVFLTVSGTPSDGQVPIATGVGQEAAWGNAAGLPLTTLGDTLYEGSSGVARLAGSTSATRHLLGQVGSGSASAAPGWVVLALADLPSGVALLAGSAFTGPVSGEPFSLADGATIATNAALGNIARVTLGGNRTFSAPSGPVDTQMLHYELTQDGTGGRTAAWASGTDGFSFGAGSAPGLTAAAGALDLLSFRYSLPKRAWLFLGSLLGY